MGTFALQIAAWIEKTNGDADKIVRYCLTAVDGRLVNRSPVGDAKYWQHPAPKGYAGGRFKGNWQMSMGSPKSGVLDVTDKGGQATIAAHASVVNVARAGEVYYLMNNLPYAKRIEQGWSRQAPVGVVALTVVEWRNIVDQAVNGVRAGTSLEDFTQGYQNFGL